jgi:hypothetical protein
MGNLQKLTFYASTDKNKRNTAAAVTYNVPTLPLLYIMSMIVKRFSEAAYDSIWRSSNQFLVPKPVLCKTFK